MNIIFHYPPELLSLLIDTIPLLFRSKKDTLLFFRGAGVAPTLTQDLSRQVATDRQSISKFDIVRTVLTRLNEKGESTLRERREILKRVTEFEDFSTCWPSDQLKVKGLVAEIRRVVNVKDSFTRMNLEREEERKKHRVEQQEKLEKLRRKQVVLSAIKVDLFLLFREQNPQKRGKALEGVLNRFFDASGILVREAFTLKGSDGEGVIEQIDGVIEIDSHVYLAEMKWQNKPLGPGDVSQHLVRVFNRGHTRGIFISASGYTEAAVSICKEALQRAVVVLCKLEEFVRLLEEEKDLRAFLKAKISAAMVDKNPMHDPTT
jgi:hypothetical protein